MTTRYDCVSCGACCMNPDDNKAEGYRWYVEVVGTKLLEKPDLRKRHVVYDDGGVPHLRLDPAGRCTALVGKIGRRATCSIYELRPKGCRMLEPGDPRCLQARRERGIDR